MLLILLKNGSAIAVGLSTITQSGKYGFKATLNGNSKQEFGGSLSGNYFW